MDPLVELARESVENYILGRQISVPAKMTPQMKERAGVFVSLKIHGELRGCIGTYEPTKGNVAEEIISNAIASATRDPRFLPVGSDELKDLSYSVDILTKPVPVSRKEELDPQKYGVIVESGWKRGLLLPDIEGVNTVDEQVGICRHKADISPDEPVTLYRFEVKRYT